MRILLLALALLSSQSLYAKDLYMIRSELSFPETMSILQEIIKKHGYQVSRVQRVDIGLTKSGYKTDMYRVVFFGKPDEVREISERYTELVPYIPLKISIFAENDETIVLAASFNHLRSAYPDKKLNKYFDRWESDIQTMLEYVRIAD
jgi:uncharacterized protein (DUF302 family)